jgi:hypothetical protein
MVGGESLVVKQEGQERVKKRSSFTVLDVISVLAFGTSVAVLGTAQAEDDHSRKFVPPAVFQAAGPTPASIQSTVDQYRAALGAVNNGNVAAPFASGRREINWDGLGSTATSLGPTPFTVFLNTRGANMTTRGTGFVQAPLDGLVATFGNPSYATIFQAFSPVRLFSPIGSNRTTVEFFEPGSNGTIPATTTGFGAVFTDVDQPNGDGPKDKDDARKGSTRIEYFDQDGDLIFSSFVPASPGDASLSFLGIVFGDARIARVRIKAGDNAPGGDDTTHRDIVMMDDFLYGEPQAIK